MLWGWFALQQPLLNVYSKSTMCSCLSFSLKSNQTRLSLPKPFLEQFQACTSINIRNSNRFIIPYLSWSRCFSGTWWACSPGKSPPEPWLLRADCCLDFQQPEDVQWMKKGKEEVFVRCLTFFTFMLIFNYFCKTLSSPLQSAGFLSVWQNLQELPWRHVCVWWPGTL